MNENNAPYRMSLPVQLLLSGLSLGSAGYFAKQGDYVLGITITILTIACFSGFRFGATRIIGSLFGFVAAVSFAPALGCSMESNFADWFGTTGLTNRFLSIGVVGFAILLGTSIMIGMIATRLFRERQGLEKGNRWLGFGIGGVQGSAAWLLLLGGILVIEPLGTEQVKSSNATGRQPRVLSQVIQVLSQRIHDSRIGPVAVACNPFTRIPQLNKFSQIQRSVQILSDPGKMDDILHHPSIKELRRQPAVQQAVAALRSDPEIREILQSGRPMDRQMAMTLMSNPTVMELVDQPGFMEEVSEILGEGGPQMRSGFGAIRPGMLPTGPGIPLSFQ